MLNNVNSTLNKNHTLSLSSDAKKRRHFIGSRCKSNASAFQPWHAWHMPTVNTVNICIVFCSLCCSAFVSSPLLLQTAASSLGSHWRLFVQRWLLSGQWLVCCTSLWGCEVSSWEVTAFSSLHLTYVLHFAFWLSCSFLSFACLFLSSSVDFPLSHFSRVNWWSLQIMLPFAVLSQEQLLPLEEERVLAEHLHRLTSSALGWSLDVLDWMPASSTAFLAASVLTKTAYTVLSFNQLLSFH